MKHFHSINIVTLVYEPGFQICTKVAEDPKLNIFGNILNSQLCISIRTKAVEQNPHQVQSYPLFARFWTLTQQPCYNWPAGKSPTNERRASHPHLTWSPESELSALTRRIATPNGLIRPRRLDSARFPTAALTFDPHPSPSSPKSGRRSSHSQRKCARKCD